MALLQHPLLMQNWVVAQRHLIDAYSGLVEHYLPRDQYRMSTAQPLDQEQGSPVHSLDCPLPAGPYDLIYADPPWQHGDASTTPSRRATRHYPVLPLAAICALPVRDLTAPAAALYLWATSALLPDALAVIAAWGFSFKTGFVWDKGRWGCGHYVRTQHEHLLIAWRGHLRCPQPSTLVGSVVHALATRHSAKPEIFYEHLERMHPAARRLELFARGRRPGWDAWGNEVQDHPAACDGG
jgi:N6-adenosine-specific RNA methylase IME4